MPQEPAHLPKCPIEVESYERLYAFNQDFDDRLAGAVAWREIRIRPGTPELDVYQLLPSAFDHEYAGYLTRSRIRYFKGDTDSAGMFMAKPCTFHSHPTRD